MKTIEERAKEYVGAPCDDGCAICDASLCKLNEYSAFIEGARSEHEELTRWNVPNELPENARDVLIKFRDATTHNIRYTVGFFADGWWQSRTINADNEILGWREIHE